MNGFRRCKDFREPLNVNQWLRRFAHLSLAQFQYSRTFGAIPPRPVGQNYGVAHASLR